MGKALDIAKKIYKDKDTERSWLPELEEIGMHVIFSRVYSMKSLNIEKMNQLIAWIILAYDNESEWLNWREDRKANKVRIAKGLGVKMDEFWNSVIDCENEFVNSIAGEFVASQASWEFQQIASLLDYNQKMNKYVNEPTARFRSWDIVNKNGEKETLREEYEESTIVDINKKKGALLEEAYQSRVKAEKLLNDIKKKFNELDNAIQGDFGFSITDEKKIDTTSWRGWIEAATERKKQRS